MIRILSLIASVSLLSIFFTACTGDNPQERAEKREQAKKAIATERDAAIAQVAEELRIAHTGAKEWQASLGTRRLTTYALQQALIRPGGQAIIVGVVIMDVAKDGDGFRLRLLAPMENRVARLNRELFLLDLKCALTDVAYDKFQLNDHLPRYADPTYLVAARIYEVKSVQEYLADEAVSTEFTATGECLGLKSIGSIYESYHAQRRELK